MSGPAPGRLSQAEAEHFGSLLGLAPAAVPSWVSFELLATPAAVARVRTWLAAGALVPTADDVVRRTRYLGDEEIRSIAVNALLEDVPPPVRAFMLDQALILGCGWSTGGWCCRVALGEPTVIVMLSGASRDRDTVRSVFLHETAHGFLLPDPARPLAAADVFSQVGALLLNAAEDPQLMREILSDSQRDERQADLLAASWGAGALGSDQAAADHTRAEAASLAATYGKH